MFHVVESTAAASCHGKSGAKPRVLVNTFDALEPEALASVPGIDLLPVGPMVTDAEADDGGGDLFQQDDNNGYMQWLDKQDDASVVDDARAIRHRARQWKARAAMALSVGASTDIDGNATAARNLRRFLQGVDREQASSAELTRGQRGNLPQVKG
uniref:Uncharacterized protein n=1 Tax=Oryza brachyantha TaxID=4533 RepID=J3N837_ORYBR